MSRLRSLSARAVGAGIALAALGGLAFAPVANAGTPSSTGAGRAVFVQTNAAAGNAVIAYRRGSDGRLSETGRFVTGGNGASITGAVTDPLASQGSLTYDASHRLLYAVNAGSDTLTVFGVQGDRLTRKQVLPTHGSLPVSVGAALDRVYVVNAGGDGSISGYRIAGGRLHPLSDSTRSLDLGNDPNPFFLTSPAQVAVTPDGRDVVVSTKTHNTLVVFPLGHAGRPSATGVVNASVAPVPFALAFDAAGRLLVTEASGSESSYRVHHDGTLSVVSAHVSNNGQVAACWSVVARGYVYTSNTGSDTITGYRESAAGALTLRDATGVTATTDHGPVDVAVTGDERFIYQLATGAGVIDEFFVGADGSLTLVGTVAGLPVDNGSGMQGIAAT